MDEEVRPEKKRPPKSVVIQSANLEDPNHGKKFLGFPGSQEHYGGNQVVIPMDGKPSNLLILISSIIIFVSTGGVLYFFFEGTMYRNTNQFEDLLCCIFCNGNAIGLALLGVFNTQYGKWQSDRGSKFSSVTSYFVAAFFFILTVVSFGFWISFQ